ncbi:MAG: hypothetical protein ACM3RP_03690 [Chitinophagales bacterium]
MRRLTIVAGVACLLLLPALPTGAVSVNGGVEVAYEYFDADQATSDDAQARLRQSYILNATGDIWAPQVASYRSGLRYDLLTQSWENPGGTFGSGVSAFSLETRLFPVSPLSLAVGATLNRGSSENTNLADRSWLTEAGAYGRFWLNASGLPSVALQVARNNAEARRVQSAVEEVTSDTTDDSVSLSTTLRGKTTQTSLSLQAARTEDKLRGGETDSRAASLQVSLLPNPQLQVRAQVNASGVNAFKPAETRSAQSQSGSVRARYQLARDESLQVSVSGGRSLDAQSAGEHQDTSAQANVQYMRPVSSRFRGVLSADYGQSNGGTPAGGEGVLRSRTALRGELSSMVPGRLQWTGAVTVDSNNEGDSSRPGAALENRVDYQWTPRFSLGAGATLYRADPVGKSRDEAARTGLQGSLRWIGQHTGRLTVGISTTAREYVDQNTGRDTGVSVSAGVTPRGDLDLSADLQYNRSELPPSSDPLQATWQQAMAVTAGVQYRPRFDWTLTANLSHQQSENDFGPRHQTIALLRGDYLFFALRFTGTVRVTDVQETGTDPRRAFEMTFSVRRDF